MKGLIALGLACAAWSLGGCGGTSGSATPVGQVGTAGAGTTTRDPSTLVDLGEKIFHDESLSASGRILCGTCHDEGHAFAQPTVSGVPLGGPGLDQPGVRNAPSLKYASRTPQFFFADDGTPTGGFDRDGRAKDLADQAIRPFITAFEMANATPADVVSKLSHANYADEFRAQFGQQIFSNSDQAFLAARQALQAYESQSEEFSGFSGQYDYFLAGRAKLSDAQLRGLALYNLGLCGPLRTDLADQADLCGAFKVPTLRNIALTAPYFHNGRFQTLQEVVGFYVRRDTNPDEWYPVGSEGLIHKFDDLPPESVKNVNTEEVPYNRRPGDEPALSPSEIDDVVAFLQTLTDGYQP